MGTEIYWHGILDYSSRENRRLREVRDVHQKLQGMKNLAGAVYEAKVGIVKDYDNVWDAQLDVWHGRVDGASQKTLFAAAKRTNTPVDFVYLRENTTLEDLKKYEVLFYPHATIMTQERADLLKEYVAAGGKLVVACRSAYKDITGKCVMDKLPGLLAELTGADVPEYSFIAPDAGKVTVDWDGTVFEASVFADLVDAQGENAKLEGTYTADYYAGSGALVSNTYGEGKAYYYGSAFNEESAKIFLEKLGVMNPYADLVSVPESCEIAVRAKGDKKYLFVLNYDKNAAEVTFNKEGLDLYTQQAVSGTVKLDGYGTMVVEF